ncbi:MAG: domain S-box protein [Planctomycetaceae bacterium]|nr:domain S-box protein [Planctomycetaceae bacterium]
MEPLELKVQQLEAEVVALRLQLSSGLSTAEASSVSNADLQQEMSDLRVSEEQYRLLFDGVQGYGIFMLDPTGHVASWNSGARSINGYQPDEILGRHFSCFYLPEDIAAGKPNEELRIATAEGRFEEEGWRVRKGGQAFWALVVTTSLYDGAGTLQGFAKVVRDISDRKQTEDKTRLMEELAVNAMILVDARGLLVLVNPQTEKLFGYSQAELTGQPVEILVPESSRANHPTQRTKFFANPSIRAMGAGRDLFARRKDGSEFPVEIGLNPLQTSEGLLVLGSIVDITERKRAEEKARKHLAELAHAGRLSSVGEMFSELAHEINQPLAAAANYARACVRCAESNTGATREQLLDWMKKAASQAERASDIVKRIGTFVKKERSVRLELNVNRLIENVIALPTLLHSFTEAGTRTSVRLELDQTLPAIFADKVQIEQVLANLIRNAVEAMEGMPDGQRRLTVKSEGLEGMIQVSVSDTGHGISAEQQVQLFNPFFTTKAEGMGLGLSISRSIIETHRGRMFAKSNPEGGATFVFQLPIGRGEAVP